MKQVLQKIFEKKQTYSNLPLFQYMRDAQLTENELLNYGKTKQRTLS
jgi:hypothetical protein